jgi:hypothetical protein
MAQDPERRYVPGGQYTVGAADGVAVGATHAVAPIIVLW